MTNHHVIKTNMLAIIGVFLSFYFSYHALFGDRSYGRLMNLKTQTAIISQTYENLHTQRMDLEKKVVGLRSGSLDKDLLEERAHYLLGYYSKDEKIILR